MQNSIQLEIRILPTSYLTPGTALEVRYPTCELGADRSFDVTASNLKALDIVYHPTRIYCLPLSRGLRAEENLPPGFGTPGHYPLDKLLLLIFLSPG